MIKFLFIVWLAISAALSLYIFVGTDENTLNLLFGGWFVSMIVTLGTMVFKA